MQEYTGLKDPVWAVRYLPGHRLVASSTSGLALWHLGEPEPYARMMWQLSEHDSGRQAVLAWSPDARWLCGATGEYLHIWDTHTNPPTLQKHIKNSDILGLATNAAGELVVLTRAPRFGFQTVVFSERKAFPWSKTTVIPCGADWEISENMHIEWLREVSTFTTNGAYFAGSTRQAETPIWDVDAKKWLGIVKLRRAPNALALSDDGALLALDAGTTLYVHDTRTQERIASWKTKYSYVPGLAWSPAGDLLARTDSSTTLRLYEARTGREVAALTNKRGRNMTVAFAPDGLTCAVGMFNGTIRIWDVG